MADEEKQTDLEKTRILLVAVLDYHLEYYAGSMVFDLWDPAAEYYLQEKEKLQKDPDKHNLEMLQQRLNTFINRLRSRVDLNFKKYIEDKTGYEIDIFEALRLNVANIIKRAKIENDDDLLNVEMMINVLSIEASGKEQINLLAGLIEQFSKCNHPHKIIVNADLPDVKSTVVQLKVPSPDNEASLVAFSDKRSKKISESEVVELQGNTGILSEHYFVDERRRVLTRTNGVEKNAVTEVSIILLGGSGCIYGVKGSHLPIKAYWEDNNTVVIETKKEYPVEIKHNSVRSFTDVVNIKYMESLI